MNFAVRAIAARVLPPGDSLAEPEPEHHDIILADLPLNQHDWSHGGQVRPKATASRLPLSCRPRGGRRNRRPRCGQRRVDPAHRACHGTDGTCSFLMADNVANSRQPAPLRLRERLLRDDLVECVIAFCPPVCSAAPRLLPAVGDQQEQDRAARLGCPGPSPPGSLHRRATELRGSRFEVAGRGNCATRRSADPGHPRGLAAWPRTMPRWCGMRTKRAGPAAVRR